MSEIFRINDIEYEWEFTISNPDNPPLKLTKSAVRGMTIIDNVFDPFSTGTVSIANPYNFLERKYFIRGDGRDEVYIMFNIKDPKGKPKNKKYEYTFVVVDESDLVNPEVRSENIKTLTLLDKSAVPFSDKIPYGKVYTGKVGKILRDIFVEMLGGNMVNAEEWADGDFELFEYIPPATYRYIDLIHHLMRIYYAKDGDIYVKGFISFDQDSRQYKLELLSKTFANHKANLLEAFAVGDSTSTVDVKNVNHPPAEAPVGRYFGAMKNLGYSTPQYGWNTDYFLNSLVFGYDKTLGVQRIEKLKFEDIRTRWTKKFVDIFTCLGGRPKPFAIKNRQTLKKCKRYHFPYPVENGVKIVEAEMHNAWTFYNLQASFSNIGDTTRRAGRFIDIITTRTRGEGGSTLEWLVDQKLLGRWFITELRHVFVADLYTNQMLCSKTYSGPYTTISEDVE